MPSTGRRNVVKATGSATRKLQTGYVRNYALGIALGMAALIIFLLSRSVVMNSAFPYLTILVLLPAGGALVLALLGLGGTVSKEVSGVIALAVSLATLGFAVATLVAMKVGFGGYQLVANHT